MDTVLQDLRYALRTLATSPGFTLGVVLTLALGIGANVTMFSVVDRMLFRPPPLLHDPSATHRVYLTWMHRGEQVLDGGVQYARYVDLTNWATSLSRTALFTEEDLAIGVGTEAREMRVAMVSASFFGFFDAPPALGRYFTTAEDYPPNGTPVAVLAYAFWQTRYGGRPEALGSTLQIGPTVYTIIGVAPKGFVGLWQVQRPVAFIPITAYGSAMAAGLDRTWWRNYGWTWASMLVQRKPAVSVAAATADLTNAYLKSYAAEEATSPGTTPAALTRPRAVVASVLSERGPNQSSFAKVATWIAGVALIVLLIACANVANLLLARVLRRKREMAVRLALGISRVRLVSQLFTECVLLALVGGAAGLLVAEWGGAVLRGQFLTRPAQVSVLGDPRTLWFGGAAALVAALLTGLAPAILSQRADVAGDLKAGAREGTFQRSRVRGVLLLVQAALCVVLLVGAGLFVRSLRHVQQLPLEYDAYPVLVVDLNMRGVRFDSCQQVALRRPVLDAAAASTRPARTSLASQRTSRPSNGATIRPSTTTCRGPSGPRRTEGCSCGWRGRRRDRQKWSGVASSKTCPVQRTSRSHRCARSWASGRARGSWARRCSSPSARWRSRWRRSVSTASWPTTCRSVPRSSASAPPSGHSSEIW